MRYPPPSFALIAARPISEATLPPVAASPRSPPFSTITATAICGSFAGAKAVYHACGAVFFESVPCSAVPVFDAIWMSGRLPPPAGEALGSDHHVLEDRGVRRRQRRSAGEFGRTVVLDGRQVRRQHRLHQLRLHRHPAVGHGGREQAVLQRGQPDVALADAALVERALRVERADASTAADLHRHGQVGLPDAEVRRRLLHLVRAELAGELRERACCRSARARP